MHLTYACLHHDLDRQADKQTGVYRAEKLGRSPIW